MAEKSGLIVNINQNILITSQNGEADWYASSIQDASVKELSIAVPTRSGRALALHIGEQVKVTFICEDTKYEFETRVTGRRLDNIPLYVLAQPAEYKRIQLREFVRIGAVLEVHCALIPEPGEKLLFIKGTSLDLSAGGIRLLLNKKYKQNAGLLLKFNLPLKTGPAHMEVTGRVVRSWPDENTGLYQSAVQFLDLSRRNQDLIVRYVLTKMSEQRRLR